MQDYWINKCTICSRSFEQLRIGRCGRRQTICTLRICERARQWMRVHKGKTLPEWLMRKWRAAYGDTRRKMRHHTNSGAQALAQKISEREQGMFLRAQRVTWIARVRHAASVNPDLTWELLGERFGVDASQVRGVCMDIPREPEYWCRRRESA